MQAVLELFVLQVIRTVAVLPDGNIISGTGTQRIATTLSIDYTHARATVDADAF